MWSPGFLVILALTCFRADHLSNPGRIEHAGVDLGARGGKELVQGLSYALNKPTIVSRFINPVNGIVPITGIH